MKGKIMDIKAMIFFFAKDCRKSPKNSLKIVICAYKWKFGSTTFHCSNSVMHELWTLNCLSNERREAYLSIHVHLIKKIYDYDSKKLHWIPVSFILGHTVQDFFRLAKKACSFMCQVAMKAYKRLMVNLAPIYGVFVNIVCSGKQCV